MEEAGTQDRAALLRSDGLRCGRRLSFSSIARGGSVFAFVC
jgi:hypothetical protein